MSRQLTEGRESTELRCIPVARNHMASAVTTTVSDYSASRSRRRSSAIAAGTDSSA